MWVYAPSQGGTLAEIEAGLLRLLIACQPHKDRSPIAAAYRKAMRNLALRVLVMGSAHTLDYLMARLCDSDPHRGPGRERILQMAWSGLPGVREP
ncbi:hypothetical protein [Methylobacterium organophilum]|nr:hypothetical protein [Methylobacterium organophilum]